MALGMKSRVFGFGIVKKLLEQPGHEQEEILAPVAPEVATGGLVVLIGEAQGVQFSAEFLVDIVKEIFPADGYPEQVAALLLVGLEFGFPLVIDFQVGGDLGHQAGGEKAGPGEEVRMVQRYVQGVESAHGKACHGPRLAITHSFISAINEGDYLPEGGLVSAVFITAWMSG